MSGKPIKASTLKRAGPTRTARPKNPKSAPKERLRPKMAGKLVAHGRRG